MPSGPVVMYTDKMTISFVASSSIFIGKRGAGFSLSYVAEGNGSKLSSSFANIFCDKFLYFISIC